MYNPLSVILKKTSYIILHNTTAVKFGVKFLGNAFGEMQCNIFRHIILGKLFNKGRENRSSIYRQIIQGIKATLASRIGDVSFFDKKQLINLLKSTILIVVQLQEPGHRLIGGHSTII